MHFLPDFVSHEENALIFVIVNDLQRCSSIMHISTYATSSNPTRLIELLPFSLQYI